MSYMPEDDQAQIAELLRLSGYPEGPITPAVQQSPDMRVGRFRVPGQGLDAAALGVLAALQRTRPAKSGLGQFAEGFAQSYAMKRARGALQRAEQNQQARASALEMEKERRGAAGLAARQVAGHRQQMERDKAAEKSATVDIPGVGRVSATSDVGARYLESKGLIPKRPVDPQIVEARQALIDQRNASIEEKRKQQEQEDIDANETALALSQFRDDPRKILTARNPQYRDKLTNLTNRFLASPEAPKKPNGTPYNVRELIALRDEADRFSKTMNTARPTQLRQSAITAYEHLKQLEEFYGNWQDAWSAKLKEPGFSNFVLRSMPRDIARSNRAVLWAAQNGMLGPKAAEDASALATTGDPVRRETEMVFSSGYAPYEAEIKSGFKRLDEAKGKDAFRGQLRAMRNLLKKRVDVATRGLPFYGGESNPYLLGVSPIGAWLQKEAEDSADTSSMNPNIPAPDSKGGKAAKYGEP